ncbi:hypothetical protein SAMN04487761_10620 [Lachnospiraceae bacterium C7]|nr:hypothetical protein SAMN04487761_10620 [Lachnospiraceae bacterium C7]
MPYYKSKPIKKKKHHFLHFIIFLVVLLALICIVGVLFYKPIKHKAVDTVAEKVIESQLNDEDSAKAKKVMDSMSESDKEKLETIIENHITPSNVSKAVSYYSKGDTASLVNMAQSELSESEIKELKKLYDKYQDDIDDAVLN